MSAQTNDKGGKVQPMEVRVNLAGLTSMAAQQLQRLVDTVAFGMLSAEAASPESVRLPSVAMEMILAKSAKLEPEAAQAQFQTWALRNGIRESVEVVHQVLEEARTVCEMWQIASERGGIILAEEWNQRIVRAGSKMHRRGLPDKQEHLRHEYDASINPDATADVLSINQCRNCLVHRNGIVHERDKNSHDGLRVTWQRMYLAVQGESGERQEITAVPTIVKAGRNIVCVRETGHRSFSVGQLLTFTPLEFSEFCWTINVYAIQLSKCLEEYGRTLGITFSKPSTDA